MALEGMMVNGGNGMMEDVAVIGGLIGLQFVYAGNAVLMSYLMSLGLNSLTIVIFTFFATFLILLPVAFYFERSRWPSKLSFKLLIQMLLLSFGGAMIHSLFLKGIELTSPAMGTAMPNLAPALIFAIAWTFRLEKVNLSCTYSKVKIIGTLLCVLGAVTMSVMQSISSIVPAKEGTVQLASPPPDVLFDRQKIIGCLCLVAGVFMLSTSIILQAFTLIDFPAPMSLCAVISFFGAFIAAAAQLLLDHEFTTGWSESLVSVGHMIAFSFLTGAVNGIGLSFNGWAIKKRGPVLVSTFSPVSTVCSIIFSFVTLGNTINIGSVAGMLMMFAGLYFVLWAKGKEGFGYGLDSEFDAEKPLLG